MIQNSNRKPIAMKFILVIIAVVMCTVGAKQVFAAAPTNDTFTSPLVVTGLPFSDVVDTTEATTDTDDAQVNSFCGAPATDASVWYLFTPTEDSTVAIDVSGSSYSAGIIVSVGNLAENFVACGPSSVGFFATAGVSYYVLAFDDQLDGGGNGGSLSISFTAVSAPTLEFTFDRFGQFNSKTGTATISGAYTCNGSNFIDISGSARQSVGRIATITGYFYFSAFDTCNSLYANDKSGRFRPLGWLG